MQAHTELPKAFRDKYIHTHTHTHIDRHTQNKTNSAKSDLKSMDFQAGMSLYQLITE